MAQDGFDYTSGFWIFLVIMLLLGTLMISLILAVVAQVYEVQAERRLDTKSRSWSASPGSIISAAGFNAVVRMFILEVCCVSTVFACSACVRACVCGVGQSGVVVLLPAGPLL